MNCSSAMDYFLRLVLLMMVETGIQHNVVAEVPLKVSPDQSQFFTWDEVSLSCGDTGHWVLKRNTSRRYNQECSDWRGKQDGSSCWMKLFPSDTGHYWCEKNGSSTDAAHITVQGEGVVLQVPVRPVSSGQTVSLICRHHNGTALPARFYRDGHFLKELPAGNMTLLQVALSDEGLYECEMSGQRSGPSRLRVRADEKLLTSSVPPSVQPSVQWSEGCTGFDPRVGPDPPDHPGSAGGLHGEKMPETNRE